MRYKDFPKHDLRRCFAVLLTIEKLGAKATMHYLSLTLECSRAEVVRAVELAQHQLLMQIDKRGAVYRIECWGVLNKDAVSACLHQAQESQNACDLRPTWESDALWTREKEALLVKALLDAIKTKRPPASDREADVYRFAAQLVKTRHPEAATALESAANGFFSRRGHIPRPFPQVLADGLVSDVSRLRHLVEHGLSGVTTW